jgi:hypothetical protein
MGTATPRKSPRKTNRLYVTAHTGWWDVLVTPSNGKQVLAHFPNRVGVGNTGDNATPAWFIKALRDLANLDKFPHLHTVLDDVAVLVQNAGIQLSRSGRRPAWGDIETMLHNLTMQARNGLAWERESGYTVLPEDAKPLAYAPSRKNATVDGAIAVFPENFTACDSCHIAPCVC